MKLQLKARALSAAVVMTTVVVILFAALQYRWSVEVSEATGVRLADTLQLSMINWQLDFLRNFLEICLTMRVDPGREGIGDLDQYAARVAEWKAIARYPDLVSDVYVIPAGGSARWDDVHIGDKIRISRDGLPLGDPRGILIQVANRLMIRIDAHRQTNLREVPEEVEMPVDHRQLERVGKPHTGRFADLDAPAILQGRKQNHDDRRHHDGGG